MTDKEKLDICIKSLRSIAYLDTRYEEFSHSESENYILVARDTLVLIDEVKREDLK